VDKHPIAIGPNGLFSSSEKGSKSKRRQPAIQGEAMASTMRSTTDAQHLEAQHLEAQHLEAQHQTAFRSFAPERRHLRQAVRPLRHRSSAAEPSWLEIRDAVTAHRLDIPRSRRCIVRALDLVVSCLALLLSTPLLVVIAAAIAGSAAVGECFPASNSARCISTLTPD
jgi:hypothetical protein